MKAGPGKLLFIRILQKYHQVVEELAFPTLYHSFYHVFVFSFLWYVEIRAWRLARYVRFNFSPFCCSRRDVHCYRFGLVESTNSFYEVFWLTQWSGTCVIYNFLQRKCDFFYHSPIFYHHIWCLSQFICQFASLVFTCSL